MIEDLIIEPVDGQFDVAAIDAHLDALAIAARDPQEPRRFLLSSQPATLDEAVAKRRAGDASISMRVVVVFPVAARILVSMRGSDVAPARAFVEWLRGQQSTKLLDEDGNVYDDLDIVFD